MVSSQSGRPRHPVDRGYSWMVCLGSFGINFFVTGGIRTTGILFIEVLELFQADKALTALTMGLMAGGFAVFSAVGNAVGAMTSMRHACLIGAVHCFLGMIITCVAPNVIAVILSLGLLSGIGYGFMLTPSLVMVGQYFNQRRALATGMAAAGGSVGTLLIPLFLNFTISYYGFRGAVLFYAGLVLHTIPAAMLLRPTSFYDVKRPTTTQRVSSYGGEKTAKDTVEAGVPLQELPKSQLDDKHVDADQRKDGIRMLTVPPESASTYHEELQTDNRVPAPQSAACAPPARRPSAPARPTMGLVLRTFIQRLFDREMLRRHMLAFVCFSIGLSTGHGGYIGACVFLPPYALEMWKSKRLAMLLITVLGLADLLGRVGGGWFADLGLVRRPLIIGFTFFVVGGATIIFTFFGHYSVAFIYVIVLGGFGGTYQALLVVVIADLFGLMKLPSAVGLSSFFMGISILPLPSIFGKVQEATSTYSTVLQLTGILLTGGGVAFYLLPIMQRRDARREETQQATKAVSAILNHPGAQSPHFCE